MNIAFVTTYDAQDIINWSGLGYHISKSLESSGNKLQYIGNLHTKVSPMNFIKKLVYPRLFNKGFPVDRTISTAKNYSAEVNKSLSGNNYDCIFSPGSIPIAYLETKVPKVFYTDATFACMLNYYKSMNNLSSEIIKQGHILEKQALDSCSLAVYASEWAAQSAIKDYGTDPAKVKVAPFGANLDRQYTKEEVESFINARGKFILKLLFNGVDWKRKGGDVVIAAVEEIKKRGIKVELHVVGIPNLPFSTVPDFIVNHGFLRKAVPNEKMQLENLYKSCHFLFLPSEAEAFGIVFCEASSFGMPSVSRKTGGIPSVITDGRNGFTLNGNSTANDYADIICKYYLDNDKYIQLARSSFDEFQTRLNWNATGELLSGYIREIQNRGEWNGEKIARLKRF